MKIEGECGRERFDVWQLFQKLVVVQKETCRHHSDFHILSLIQVCGKVTWYQEYPLVAGLDKFRLFNHIYFYWKLWSSHKLSPYVFLRH